MYTSRTTAIDPNAKPDSQQDGSNSGLSTILSSLSTVLAAIFGRQQQVSQQPVYTGPVAQQPAPQNNMIIIIAMGLIIILLATKTIRF